VACRPIGKKIALVQCADSAASTFGVFLRPGAVVEGQDDLAFAQRKSASEVLEAEAGPAGGVDLDRAGDAQAVGIAAGACGRCGRGLRDHDRLLGRTGSRPCGINARTRPDC
jgi:hypothetical protein